MTQEVLDRLGRIPELAGVDPASLGIERLGGLTNRNYKLVAGDDRYVMRIAGEGTEQYIDRKTEESCARIAAEAGVNADVVFFDAADGLQLCRYIDDCVTMDAARLEDLGAVARAAEAFHRIHTCGKQFPTRFELFAMMDEYLALLEKRDARIPDGYAEVQKEADTVRAALDARPAAIVPAHCDPLAENLLDTGERMYIVDWEYAGNNDAMWDLGDLSVEAEFGAEQDAALMAAYFGGEPPADQIGRMVMYKAMCDLLWTLWGVIQHVNDNPAEDFWAYAVNRFERCQALMGSPDFGRHLDAVRRGGGQ